MELVTAAGIGLGAISVAFQLFSGCIKGYQLLVDAVDTPKKFEHLQIRVRLEQVRLLRWGEKVGLLQDVLEVPSSVLQLHQNLIFDILLRVSQLFTEFLGVQRRFSALIKPNTNDRRNHSSVFGGLIEEPDTATLFTKATGILQRTSEVPRRLEWAMVKQEKLENLVRELISYNDTMFSLLDSVALEQINESQKQTTLTLLQLSTDTEVLKQIIQAAQFSSLKRHTGTPLVISKQLDLARLATFKAQYLANNESDLSLREACISAKDIQTLESTLRVDIAMCRSELVWIEWKEFDQDNKNPWYQKILERRVEKLTALLRIKDAPPEFRKPDCLGYVHEQEEGLVRYGLINKVPRDVQQNLPPITLLDLIRRERRPSLSQRVRLATLLASSLLHLHSVNWLHKGFRSENIIFFYKAQHEVAYDQPVISGFEYSRPDESGELTEKPQSILEHDMYRPPQSLKNPQVRSQKSWDIYGLGVILVEISAWRGIDKIADIDMKAIKAKSKIRRIREFLLQDHILEQVSGSCGDRYREVVTKCLTGGHCLGTDVDADESDPRIGSDMIQIFSRDIVDVLQNIRV